MTVCTLMKTSRISTHAASSQEFDSGPGTNTACHTVSSHLKTRMSHRQCGFFVVPRSLNRYHPIASKYRHF
jgi:hypothetical protein